MNKKNSPEILIVVSGVIITLVVLIVCWFDSPRFDNVSEILAEDFSVSYSSLIPEEGKIDINSAGIDELCALYGVGEVKSQAIIDYRRDNGGFFSIEELVYVKGISEKILNRNIDIITVGQYTEEAYEVQSD